jgi:hypothetical protein
VSDLIFLFFAGLGDNKITDMSIDLSAYNIIDFLVPKQVHMLDLSHNKLTKIETLTYLFKSANVTQLSVESNLLTHFDINELLMASPELANEVTLNLKHNFIRNTSADFFRVVANDYDSFSHNHTPNWERTRFSLQLVGNPLVCDCGSMWLLEEAKRAAAKRTTTTTSPAPVSKRRLFKPNKKQQSALLASQRQPADSIRLLYKRNGEQISAHYTLDDPNFDAYMHRKKRLQTVDQPANDLYEPSATQST